MKTTQQWWDEVSSDETKMNDWLRDQFHGEVTAAARIEALLTDFVVSDTHAVIIKRIASDERKHAEWVKQLLISRGIEAEVLEKEERYWNEVLPTSETSFEYMCAVGHLAETMRLERINLLASDVRFKDIAETFALIQKDEVFHAAAFAKMSTPEHIEEARKYHEQGLNALGLIA